LLLTPSVESHPKTQLMLRSLSPFETILWLMDGHSPIHATLAFQVSGRTAIQDWHLALEATRRRHPLWSAVIRKNSDSYPFFQYMKDPHVAVRVVRGDFADSWEQELAHEVNTPIDPANGPLVRATLLHTETSCMLILCGHHSMCDGMSLAFAARDVLRSLSGQELEVLAPRVSLEESLGLPGKPHKAVLLKGQASGSPLSEVFRAKTDTLPKVQSLKLSQGMTAKLRDRARSEKTSVHGALIAAAVMAARKDASYRPAQDLRICSTLNNRKFLGLPEDCSMLFSAFGDPFADEELPAFWDLARAAKRHLQSAEDITGVKALLGAVNDSTAVALNAGEAAGRPGRIFLLDIHLSNLGVLPIEPSYGGLSVTSVWGPAVLLGFEGEQTLGISTVNGSMCLLHTSHSAIPFFLTHIEESLNAAL